MEGNKNKRFLFFVLAVLTIALIFPATAVANNGFSADSGVYDLIGQSTNDHTDAFYLWEHEGFIYVALSTSLKEHQLWGLTINGVVADTGSWLLDGSNLTVKDSGTTEIIIDNEPATGKSAVDYFWLIGKVDIDISEVIIVNLSSPGGFALVNVVYSVRGALNVFHEYPPDGPFQDFDQSEASNTIGGLAAGLYEVNPEDPPEVGYEYSSVTINVDGVEQLSVDSGETDSGSSAEVSFLVDEEGKVTVTLAAVSDKIINIEYLYELSDYDLTLAVAPSGSGVVTGAGSYNSGDEVPITATANVGWEFVNWTEGATVVSTAPNFVYTMPARNVTLTANFAKIDYTLSLAVAPSGSGVVTGAGSYNSGDEVPITATANVGWEFVNWTEGAIVVSTVPNFAYTMPARNVTLTANFEQIPDELDGEWVEETAWADGSRYTPRGNWATYTPYVTDSTVILYAGQHMKAGTVHFSAPINGKVTITIALAEGWRFEDVKENVKIQDYSVAPKGSPAPGRFAYKANATGMSFNMDVANNIFYGVHVNVEWLK